MSTIKDELLLNASRLNIMTSVLSVRETDEIVDTILKKYIDSNENCCFIWENMKESEYVNDPLGWSYVDDFVGKEKCLIMFFEFNNWVIMRISSGISLKKLLEESFAFEFYIVDEDVTYVICFNHHDQLIGVGKAKEWIVTLK